MSDYTVIQAVSSTIQEMLRQNITLSTDPQIKNIPIDLRSPKDLQIANVSSVVSVWLYRVIRDGDLLNAPPQRIAVNQHLTQPLPLTLHYLVTPISPKVGDEQALLGRVIQVLNDHAILRGSDLTGVLDHSDEQLRVVLEPLSLEELTRVWLALSEPYKLSTSYMVQVVKIDSDREPVQKIPVVIKNTTFSEIV
jgi:Pvc16 N-terminal domain